jgi:predicted nuclease with TOPRIM domain
MKKNKRILFGSAIGFIALIFFQVFSTGHGHVVVVQENESLTTENKLLTTENKGLKNNLNSLKSKNKKLVEEKSSLESLFSEAIGSLDSTKKVVKEIKKDLENEKNINIQQSSGEQFNFQSIDLPVSDDN